MAKTQTYSHTEIERYLQHKMSQQEMHDFEKALMNDPFLADALEGFSSANIDLASEHLGQIEKSIIGTQQKAKVVPLVLKKTEWWKVAAIILVMVSAASITYSVVNKSWYHNAIVASTPTKGIIEKDSIKAVDKPLAESDITLKKSSFNFRQNSSPIIRLEANGPVVKEEQSAGNKIPDTRYIAPSDSLIAAAPVAISANADTASSRRMMFSRSSAQNEFKGKVVDKSGEPLAFVDIKANNGSISTTSDAHGNFALKAPDSVVEVDVNSPGYAGTKAKINRNKTDTKITLKESELSLSEVVVTALSNKNKKAPVNIRVDSSDAATPVGGWKNFQQYLSTKQDFIKGIESYQNSNEELILEFSIDQHGQPTEIKVPQEMDKTTAEKTIETITNGPRWKNNKKDKKVKVIIGF